MKQDYRKNIAPVDNSKNIVKYAHDYKKTYLFLYNLIMFILYLKILIIFMIKTISGTIDDDTLEGANILIRMINILQFITEIPHQLSGFIGGDGVTRCSQIFTRLGYNFLLVDPEIRQSAREGAYYLIVVWSLIEMIRYSYYALKVFKVENHALTWCRYTISLPLYVLEAFFKAIVIYQSVRNVNLNNGKQLDVSDITSFCLTSGGLLRIYCLLVLCPSAYKPIQILWKRRPVKMKPQIKSN